ncbi:MAG: carbohydrate kinase family protein [Opitutaceae bacterium]
MNSTFKVAGIGEILWDVFPDGQRIGGAPANFAYHCHQLGAHAFPISALGADELGELARSTLASKRVDTSYVQETEAWPTSRVLVTRNAQGKPDYTIIENVAWDHLQLTDALVQLAPTIDAVCFGVLSQRNEQSRTTIQSFLDGMSTSAIKVFDINLRQSYFSKELVEQCLKRATVLKLSDEELPQLAEYFGLEGTDSEQLAELRAQFSLDLVAYTRGGEGSILTRADEVDVTPGCKVVVADSVGAGDSFTAALCIGLLKGWSLSEVNQFANKVAAYVCSQEGATPPLPAELIHQVSTN